MARAAVWLSACLFARLVLSLEFIDFNRTIPPISPSLGWEFSPQIVAYASRSANASRQDPFSWVLDVDLSNFTEKPEPPDIEKVRFDFSGTGIMVSMTAIERGATLPNVSCMTQSERGSAQFDLRKSSYQYDRRVTADAANLKYADYRVKVMFDSQQRYTIDNITCSYRIPIETDRILNMTEIAADGSEIPQALPVTPQNDTWLSGALAGTAPGAYDYSVPTALNSSTAKLVELPPNVSFVSVLGPKHLTPGKGGECRFVFDPPFRYRFHNLDGLNYTYADTGNPYFVNVPYPKKTVNLSDPTRPTEFDVDRAGGSDVVHDTYLLNQQLNASVRYRFAIVDGPIGDGIIGFEQDGDRSSPKGCEFTKIQLWTSIPDPTKQKDDTQPPPAVHSDVPATDGSARTAGAQFGSTRSLSSGVIAGMVVGIVLGLLLVLGFAACVWRHRRRDTYDDFDNIQDDTKVNPYVAPLGPLDECSILGGQSPDVKHPRSDPPRRIVHREEDAGALRGDNGELVEVDVLPPLYREEWNTEVPGAEGERRDSNDNAAVRGTKRRRPSGPRPVSSATRPEHTPITAEEIKFLGAPVTSNLPSGLSMRHQRITAEERKRLGGSQSTIREETSRSSQAMTLEDVRLSVRTSFTDESTPAPMVERRRGVAQPTRPVSQQRSRQQRSRKAKGKGVMDGEKTPVGEDAGRR